MCKAYHKPLKCVHYHYHLGASGSGWAATASSENHCWPGVNLEVHRQQTPSTPSKHLAQTANTKPRFHNTWVGPPVQPQVFTLGLVLLWPSGSTIHCDVWLRRNGLTTIPSPSNDTRLIQTENNNNFHLTDWSGRTKTTLISQTIQSPKCPSDLWLRQLEIRPNSPVPNLPIGLHKHSNFQMEPPEQLLFLVKISLEAGKKILKICI